MGSFISLPVINILYVTGSFMLEILVGQEEQPSYPYNIESGAMVLLFFN